MDDPRLVQLSRNWVAGEFQCKCGCGYGLRPGDVSALLVDGLQQMRDGLGAPLYCVHWNPVQERWYAAGSGCRCREHNKRVGGVGSSRHTRGEAADIWGAPVGDLVRLAEQVPQFYNGGIGRYDRRGFVHVDVRGYKKRWQG